MERLKPSRMTRNYSNWRKTQVLLRYVKSVSLSLSLSPNVLSVLMMKFLSNSDREEQSARLHPHRWHAGCVRRKCSLVAHQSKDLPRRWTYTYQLSDFPVENQRHSHHHFRSARHRKSPNDHRLGKWQNGCS